MRSVVAVAVVGSGDADHASRQFVLIMAAADSADCYQPGKYVSCPTSNQPCSRGASAFRHQTGKKEHESRKYWLQLQPRKQATPLHLAIVKIVVETRNATDLAHGLLE